MKHLSSDEIRKIWLSFWKAKDHLIVPSANLIPINDNSVLWINAGVTPLKKFFDGSSIPENKRLVNVQKCIRTGDIESVGDATHLTFFEMMGNFSIGNYFKAEAITWGYELLTKEEYFNFDKEKLYFTVHPSDKESKELWLKLGVAPDHIIELKGNFWEIGEGPCGPCSEIFYDRGPEYDKEKIGITLLKDDLENSRYVEIWNIVFSSFNAVEGVPREEYKDLPSKNIDTGMGLERMALVMQEVPSIYETDLFKHTIQNVELITNVKYDGQPSFRIIADHIRTVTMALKDGASFGNSGRGYVIRRLLRRAVREGYNLGLNKPFLYRLVPIVASIMQDFYPFTGDETKILMELVMVEEELFHKTLISGEEKIKSIIATNPKMISGEDAFKLYDTYGYPLELTLEAAREHNLSVDTSRFLELMNEQRKKSQASSNMENNMSLQNPDLISCEATSVFVGYEKNHVHTKVTALFDKDGNRVTDLYNNGYIMLEETPFYAEAGGQIYDTGFMRTEQYKEHDRLIVLKVIKAPKGQHLHLVRILDGVISQGEPIEAKIDVERRNAITINHSAAHLLHHALKETLSDKLYQAGSYIDENRLRFDFNFIGDITEEALIIIEASVNQMIKDSITDITEMPLEEAKEMGATALFDDKYGAYVRTVRMGDTFELCGGTHVHNTKDIESFAIINCESKGANVYRIEATTKQNINILLHEQVASYKDNIKKLLQKASELVHTSSEHNIDLTLNYDFNLNYMKSYADVLAYRNALKNLSEEVKRLEKDFQRLYNEKALSNLSNYTDQIQNNSLIMITHNQDIPLLKQVIDKLSHEHELHLVFIANVKGNNVNYLAKVDVQKAPTLSANDLVKYATEQSNGNGGGSATFAQGGGTDITHLDAIIKHINHIYQEMGL